MLIGDVPKSEDATIEDEHVTKKRRVDPSSDDLLDEYRTTSSVNDENSTNSNTALNNNNDPTYRPPSLVDLEHVIDCMSVESNLFAGFLQENYLHFFTDINDVVGASQALSDGDQLMQFYEGYQNEQITEQINQNALLIAARGLMYHNQHPLQTHVFKSMYKPLPLHYQASQNKKLVQILFPLAPSDLSLTPTSTTAIQAPYEQLIMEHIPMAKKLPRNHLVNKLKLTPSTCRFNYSTIINPLLGQMSFIDIMGNYSAYNTSFSRNALLDQFEFSLEELSSHQSPHTSHATRVKDIKNNFKDEMRRNAEVLAQDDIVDSDNER